MIQPIETPAKRSDDLAAAKKVWYAAARAAAIQRWAVASLLNIAAAERQAAEAAAPPTPPPPPPPPPPPVTFASGRCGGDLPSCCTLHFESGGNIEAVEPGHAGASAGDPGDPEHHASGKWQFMPGTWNRYQGYPYAAAAPESVQDAKAREVYAGGEGEFHWYGDGCYNGR